MIATKFRQLPFTLIAAVLIGLGGCSDATGPEATLGVYRMQTFRGEPLPALSTDGVLYVRGGVLELKSGSQFTLDMDTDYCQGGVCEPNEIRHVGSFSTQNGFFTLQMGSDFLRGRFYEDYLTMEDDTPDSVWLLVD